ncbi:Signal transduction histidine kinase [Ohtaekwangia koreensis]|uniref:histidine kinase n=2 Tax=Ohtaekwangia koreensis TaxID=688867 RepID=A0A1T5KH71_9BACT|nr:Signal transduction histidine kinase [Ohtaekwangia koreensis]
MPSRIYSFLLFLLLQLTAALSPHHGYGQKQLITPIMAYNHSFTTVNGLSQNNVTSILKDRDGFIWINTGEGIDRFDGYSFVNFVHSDRDSSSLGNSAVKNMLLDSKGQLWVGTYHGLNLYDNKTETFRKFLMEPPDDYSSHSTIFSLLEDRHHQLWVASRGIIYKINIETLAIKKYDYRNDSTGLDAVNALLEDRHGKIWAATRRGICILNSAGIVERTIYYEDTHGNSPNDMVISMVQDATGALYFGSNGMGVLRLNDENDKTFKYFTSEPGKPFFGSDIIGSLAIDKDGKLLVGTDGAGIYKQDDDGNFRQILGNQSRRLHNGNIGNIFVNDDNSYWFGLYGGGLQIVYAGTRRFEHYRYFDLDMERMEKNSILAIAEDQHQKVWIGTDGAGLYRFDPQTKLFTSYRHSSTNKNSLSSNVVKSLAVDKKNNLYAGTFGGGLNYLDTKTGSFSRYIHIPGNNASISTNHVWSLLEASNHTIYAGQLAALDEFFPYKKVFKPLTIPGSIFSLAEDSGGNIWIGSRLDGLHRYEPETKTFKSFLNIPADSASMPTNEISDLTINFQGKLWVGTANKGLILFDPEKFSFERIAPLKEKRITNILEDDSHNVWFTSVDGVHKFDPSTSLIYDYTIADGSQGTQFNEGARLKSSDGTYYLGGTNGLNVFRPENIADDTTKAKVVFTQLTLFSIPVKINDKSGLLTQSISQTESITLQADQKVFSLEFACLEFNFPKKTKYRYYLEGFDKAWNDANASRTATYTNLPPGSYTLKVSASNRSGHWNENAASIKIIVIPKWYERSGTKYGAAIFLTILTVLIIHLRTKLLFKQKIKLERLVKARTNLVETQKIEIKDKNRKLEQAYEEVSSTNDELHRVNLNLEKLVENRTTELTRTINKLTETDKGLETFLYRSSHDLRGPIATILGLAHLGKMPHSVEELTVYFANIEKTSTRMLRLLKRLDETSSLFRAQRTLELIHVDELIQNIDTTIKELNTDNIVKIEFENRINQVFSSDATLLKCIIVNLMENSIVFRDDKHPYATCVLSMEQGQLIINVIDNGTGIPSSVMDRISNMFYRGSEKSIGNGLGLFMVKKALEILEGNMEIKSEYNVMTTITVRIPCA